MASITQATSRCSLLGVPPEIIAEILAQSDSIRQLVPAIQSHRVFRDALNDQPHFITHSIIAAHIPPNALPFLVALLTSTRISPNNYPAVHTLIWTLAVTTSEAPKSLSQFAGNLSLSDYDFLFQNYATAEFLVGRMAKKSAPHGQHLSVATSRIVTHLTAGELPPDPSDSSLSAYQEEDRLRCDFFRMFAPSVNEQLLCVYAYLESEASEAFDFLVAHDVNWGELSISWDEDAFTCPYIQSILSRGLPFLRQVVCADTYDKKIRLLGPQHPKSINDGSYPFHQLCYMSLRGITLPPLGLKNGKPSLDSYALPQLQILRRTRDDPANSTASGPFHLWLGAHWSRSVFNSVISMRDRNLWDCGYVLWDNVNVNMTDIFRECDAPIPGNTIILRHRDTWLDEEDEDYEDPLRSQSRRTDISFMGGTGYWPSSGIDFSSIKGLSEGQKMRLLERWKKEDESSG
ncbi:hypothetical protein F5Y06DRAFT_304883 [Hypoxylon sp. FL0890]|nr:hypothetical protein F5Y06DRAFT_304883 [Hypoxylon sp. FL0890]